MHTALARIAGQGPVRFDQFQADALYGPDGFYVDGGAAGRGGDFITAVETGRDFAESVALELDASWAAAGWCSVRMMRVCSESLSRDNTGLGTRSIPPGPRPMIVIMRREG